ncbi:MAG TPA: 3-phosphoglycerate dehydrogenase family protein [Vicinamibacterales bacterium]|nr:3-phosphoglycerate dehydrogenase family protein [Vicinamibacterales bacterium]
MKVLVADKFEKSGLEALKAAGCEVLFQPDASGDALVEAIRTSQASVLVVRSTQVTEQMMDAGTLSLIVRAGAGVNTIDVAAASKRGIYVSNCPGKNSVAVAELTMGLILALDRRIPANVSELKAGKWNKKEYSKAKGLMGQTLGLLGFGHIGREVAKRARAFGMPVLVWTRRFSADPAARQAAQDEFGIQVVSTPEELLAKSDIVSLHIALTKETRGFVNAALLAHAKTGACIINTARAEVMDYAALTEAVKTKGLRVGLDVFDNEPSGATAEFADALACHDSVYGTHHIGASTDQAQEAIAEETVRIIRTFKETGKVPNVVNLAKQTPATHMLVVRHRDKPGVLAHVFEYLRVAHLNVQETENIIFDGAHAAVARINLDGAPSPRALDAMQSGNADILDLQLVKLS